MFENVLGQPATNLLCEAIKPFFLSGQMQVQNLLQRLKQPVFFPVKETAAGLVCATLANGIKI
mgnify:CR=1 FL=1